MNKPSTLIYEDFKREMADLINNSGLPFFIVENVLQNFLIEVKDAAKKQYQIDKLQYEKSLSEKDEKKEDNEK